MAYSTKVGAFNTGTGAAATTVDVTIGFQPKMFIVWWSGRTESVDTTGRLDYNRGIGAGSSDAERRCAAEFYDDANTGSTGGGRYDDTALIQVCNASGVVQGSIDIDAVVNWPADGIRLIVDDNMPLDLRVHYLALGGTDLTNAVGGQFAQPAVTGNFDVTSVGFQPDCVLFFGLSSELALDAPQADATPAGIFIGAAVSSSARWAFTSASDDGSANMDAQSYGIATECIAMQPDTVGTSVVERDDFVSFLSNGFRLNAIESATARRAFYVALKGGQYAVGNLLTQTDTTTDITVSGLAFQPIALFFASNCKAASTANTAAAHDQMSIGAATSITERGAQGIFYEDGTADSVIETSVEHDEVYTHIDGAGIVGLMDLKSIESNGFTCIMDDADPAQALVGYIAIGATIVGGTDQEPALIGGKLVHASLLMQHLVH